MRFRILPSTSILGWRFKNKTNMKTNSTILIGKKASGKTFIAETIASVLESNRVLRIDACGRTIVGIAREINKRDFDLIIFEECNDIKFIKHLDKLIKNHFVNNSITVKALVYLTQDCSFKKLDNFKIIECTYDSKLNLIN